MNGDGSVAQMCGNGIRCLAQYLANIGAPSTLRILTGAGVICTDIVSPGTVAVNMGHPRLLPGDVPTLLPAEDMAGMILDCPIDALGEVFSICALSMGNPHGVPCCVLVIFCRISNSIHDFLWLIGYLC